MKFASMLLASGLCMQGCVHAANESAPAPATRPVLEQYLEISNRQPSEERNRELYELDKTFWNVCQLQPARKGWAEGIITDDHGVPLQGVDVEATWHEPVTLSNVNDRPVARQRLMVDGAFAVPLDGHDAVKLSFRKAGYAQAGWSVRKGRRLGEAAGCVATRLDSARASHVEPRTDGGPGVWVVLGPAQYEWDPSGDEQFFKPDPKFWPKQFPKQMPEVLNSQALSPTNRHIYMRVKKTGTYVAADRNGKVVLLVRLLRGNRVSFRDTDPRGRGVQINYVGSGDTYPLTDAPYSWYLYSVATPIYPTTQPTTRANEVPAVQRP